MRAAAALLVAVLHGCVVTGQNDHVWSRSPGGPTRGLGGLIAAYLATRGWSVSPASVAWPVVFIGLGQFIHSNTLETGSAAVDGAITW